MDHITFIKNGLHVQALPVYENDIPYIQNILHTVKQAQESLQAYPYLNTEVPITVVDKGLIQ